MSVESTFSILETESESVVYARGNEHLPPELIEIGTTDATLFYPTGRSNGIEYFYHSHRAQLGAVATVTGVKTADGLHDTLCSLTYLPRD